MKTYQNERENDASVKLQLMVTTFLLLVNASKTGRDLELYENYITNNLFAIIIGN